MASKERSRVSACAQPLPLGWRRVSLCREGLPDRAVWLGVKRSLSPTPKYGYDMSNARVSAPLSLFVWRSGRRCAIEQSFEESQSDVGMDHYEVRTYGSNST